MKTYDKPMEDVDIEQLIEKDYFSSGQSRLVFRVTNDPDVVVKKVKNDFPGPNLIEWNIWNSLRDTNLENVFGQCVTISRSGRYLMMEYLRDTDAQDNGKFPAIPDWMTDRKRSAFGKDAQGNIKIRDYAGVKLGATLEMAPRFKVSL